MRARGTRLFFEKQTMPHCNRLCQTADSLNEPDASVNQHINAYSIRYMSSTGTNDSISIIINLV